MTSGSNTTSRPAVAESKLNVNMLTSADVQKLRDDLDRRAGGLPDAVRAVTWRALCAESQELAIERTDKGAFVTIPEIGAWNAGYLDFRLIND